VETSRGPVGPHSGKKRTDLSRKKSMQKESTVGGFFERSTVAPGPSGEDYHYYLNEGSALGISLVRTRECTEVFATHHKSKERREKHCRPRRSWPGED